MSIPGAKPVRQIAHWVRSRMDPGGLILGYHRVAEAAWDPYGMTVSPQHFEEHLAAIRERAQPLAVTAMLDHLKAGTLPAKAVALTFDDGYDDTFDVIMPLLEQYEIPATIFVTTGCPEEAFWWDELIRLVPLLKGMPERLSIRDGKRDQAWLLNTNVTVAGISHKDVLLVLYRILLQLPKPQHLELLAQLRSWAGSTPVQPSMRLNSQQIVTMARSDWIDVGAHTVNHPILTMLCRAEQQYEIYQSKAYLEELLGRPVDGFSYPNGAYSRASNELVQSAGFRFACISAMNVVRSKTDRFALPRFWARDCPGTSFKRWLERWISD